MTGDGVSGDGVRRSTVLWVAGLVVSTVAYLWVGPASTEAGVVPAAGASVVVLTTTTSAGGGTTSATTP